VLQVRRGNPRQFRTLTDVQQPGVRLALANAETAAIGRLVRTRLGERYPALAAHAAVQKPTVTEIAADVDLGAADAAIVWDSTVPQFRNTEAIALPEFAAIKEEASVGVLAFSTQSAEALRFARYLAAPEKGGAIFKQHGFTPVPGDAWAATQELILYSGGVNRPAIERLLKEFAEREGAKLTTVFNGCGILCASMKTMAAASDPKFPDAYYACDLCFIPPVAKEFPETLILTETEIGIAVSAGNPKAIRELADLARPGLRVGLCNAEQSTLGFMTQAILTDSKLNEAVRKNVVVEVPTADFLINQMRAGALDAAIVYRVNAQLQEAHFDFLTIAHPGARAQQPFSVRTASPRRQLATRLLAFLKGHRAEFEKAGFTWRGEEAPLRSENIEIPAWLRPNRATTP
jgi:molybdate transport system substrate-binding protein